MAGVFFADCGRMIFTYKVFILSFSIIASSYAWSINCEEVLSEVKPSENFIDGFMKKFNRREDGLKFLKDRVGKNIRVLVFEYGANLSEALHEFQVDSVRQSQAGVYFFKVTEEVSGERLTREVPFSRLEVLGEAFDLNIKFRSLPVKEAKEVLKRRYADTWHKNFDIFYQAFRSKAQVVVSNPNDSRAFIGRVEAIDIDSMGIILVRLANVNGANTSKTIQLPDFRNVEIIGQLSSQKKELGGVFSFFQKGPNEMIGWEKIELPHMEYMTPERKNNLSVLEQSMRRNQPVQWKENGKSVVGSVGRLFVDESYMVIVEIKDLNSNQSVYRTLKGLDGISLADVVPGMKASNRVFENADTVIFNISEDGYAERTNQELQLLEYWKSALVMGSNVRWYQFRGSVMQEGRIEQIYSDASNEVLVVVRIKNKTVVQTLEGFLIVPPAAKALEKASDLSLKLRYGPTITNDGMRNLGFNSRFRISGNKEREIVKYNWTEEIEILKVALYQNKQVDLQFRINPPGQFKSMLVEEKKRAKILSIEDEVVIIQLEGALLCS